MGHLAGMQTLPYLTLPYLTYHSLLRKYKYQKLPKILIKKGKNTKRYLLKKKEKKIASSEEEKSMCQKWDSNPRLHSETRTPAPMYHGKDTLLESGALDRSAILTTLKRDVIFYLPFCWLFYIRFPKFTKMLF